LLIESQKIKLEQYRAADLYRCRRVITDRKGIHVHCDGQRLINFSGNDYLGLANHADIINAAQQGMLRYGVGSGASSLVCGYYHIHRQLEDAFAEFLNRDRALLFNSGYMANLGVVNALLSKKDAIFADKYNHASLVDASRLSRAIFYRYAHNDLSHLQHYYFN